MEPEPFDPYGLVLQRYGGQHHYRFEPDDKTMIQPSNLTRSGEQFPMFVAVEYYKSSTINNPKHLTKVGETLAGGKLLLEENIRQPKY
jgi:hypothetical protein